MKEEKVLLNDEDLDMAAGGRNMYYEIEQGRVRVSWKDQLSSGSLYVPLNKWEAYKERQEQRGNTLEPLQE